MVVIRIIIIYLLYRCIHLNAKPIHKLWTLNLDRLIYIIECLNTLIVEIYFDLYFAVNTDYCPLAKIFFLGEEISWSFLDCAIPIIGKFVCLKDLFVRARKPDPSKCAHEQSCFL